MRRPSRVLLRWFPCYSSRFYVGLLFFLLAAVNALGSIYFGTILQSLTFAVSESSTQGSQKKLSKSQAVFSPTAMGGGVGEDEAADIAIFREVTMD